MATVEAVGGLAPAWRGAFGRLWTAAVVSRFGDALRGAALPLLAASLTDRPLLIASVTACGCLPWIVFGLLGGRREIAEGLRTLWRDRALRGLCAATALCNIGMGALIATSVVLVTGRLDAGTAGYAAATTAYTVGGLAGGVANRQVTARLGPTRTVLLAGLVQTDALVVMDSVRSLTATAAALAVFGFTGMVWNVNTTTLMQQRTPAELLGRVGSAFRALAVAGAPLGALLGGAVATAWGLNTPALLAAAFFVLSVLALIPARKPDVPVVAPHGDTTTVHVTR